MIDIHSHILPGVDDGAQSLDTSIEMARIAVDAGCKVMACTPHIKPPQYPNDGPDIRERVARLQSELSDRDLDLFVVVGADIHIGPDLISGLESGHLPCLHKSRYFLFEPDHKVLTPNIDRFCARVMEAGYIPVLTHPERLAWVHNAFPVIERLYKMGVQMQITAGAVTGRFGSGAAKIAEKMAERNMIDVLASDAHNTSSRRPGMVDAFEWAQKRFGKSGAIRLTYDNPLAILTGKATIRTNGEAGSSSA